MAGAILIQRNLGHGHQISSAPLTKRPPFMAMHRKPTAQTTPNRSSESTKMVIQSNPTHPSRYIQCNRHPNAHHPPPDTQSPSTVEQIRSSRPVAIPLLISLPMMSITEIQPPRLQRTSKLQRRRTILRQMVTKILTWQHFLIRSRFDLLVNHRITRDVEVICGFVF